MRKRKLKRKGKFVFFRLIIPIFLLPLFVTGSYFFLPTYLNKDIISPLAKLSVSRNNNSIEDSLRRNNVEYYEINTATDSSYLVGLIDGGIAIVTPKKNIEEQISSLQLMINRLTIEGKRIKLVDFRYDRPIVRL